MATTPSTVPSTNIEDEEEDESNAPIMQQNTAENQQRAPVNNSSPNREVTQQQQPQQLPDSGSSLSAFSTPQNGTTIVNPSIIDQLNQQLNAPVTLQHTISQLSATTPLLNGENILLSFSNDQLPRVYPHRDEVRHPTLSIQDQDDLPQYSRRMLPWNRQLK